MQTRELLSKIDDKTANPGVRYGPGPKFSEKSAESKSTMPKSVRNPPTDK